MGAAELGRAIRAGEADAVEVTEAFLEAIAAHPDAGNIYARTTPERARAEAEAAAGRAKARTLRGPLDGVPISWKDLYDSAGVATEAGSALLEGRVPSRDALVLRRATQAGMVCLGKTHMTELAFSGLGINPVTATPPNAVREGCAPGGSSSGAAVSTKLGLAAAGIGSDTGGSVRIPAAWNDLVGLKTTAGLISLEGVVKLCPKFDTVGPLAHTVEDAAHLHAALSDSAPVDISGVSAHRLRLLVCETFALDDVEEEPLAAFEDAVDRLAAAGAEIVRAQVPSVADAMGLSGVLYTPEAYATCGEMIEAAPEKMYPMVLERFRAGRDVSVIDYLQGWQALKSYRRAYAAETAGFDAVLVPSGPILPPDAARLLAEPEYFVERNLMTLRNTRIGNLLGLCALTLPTGVPSCGLMAMGRPFGEAHLLRVGAALEGALGVG